MVRAFSPMAKTISTSIRLAAWIAHKKLSMREVARRSGVTVQTVSMVVAGESDISTGKLNLICTEALDCSLAEFFGPLPKERAA